MTTRGTSLKLDDHQIAARLITLWQAQEDDFNARKRVILYSLVSGRNGGANPRGATPDVRPDGSRTWTSDCIGTQLWAAGEDRYQPVRMAHLYGGYLNTNSIIIDAFGDKVLRGAGSAKAEQKMWRPCTVPRPGTFVVYGSKFTAAGVKVPGSWGHIMGVVGVRAAEWDPHAPAWGLLDVVHCHGGARGKTVRAIDKQTAASVMGAAGARAHLVELIRQ